MKKYIKYLSYVIRHKWHVAIECFKMGLIWRGIMHDVSKLLPSEFIPYARHFYGNHSDTDKMFDKAWLLHIHRNPHHWQFWILRKDDGGIKLLEMPYNYVREMVCDWVGAGKALGRHSPSTNPLREVKKWYKEHKKKMQLHSKTRNKVEIMLGLRKLDDTCGSNILNNDRPCR